MKTTRFLVSIFLIGLTTTLSAQTVSSAAANEAAYKAYLSSEPSNNVKETWKKIVAQQQAELNATPNDKTARFKLTLAQYGLLTSTMRDKDEDLFDDYIDETIEHLETLIEENEKWGDPKALLGGLYGMKIMYSPLKAMYYGPKSSGLMDEALKNSPDSPLVWKLYGNSKFFTPEMWGGDIEEAIKAYERSVQLYESEEQTTHNWFYLDTFAFLGQAYVKNNQKDKAIIAYEKALTLEPNYSWVKYQLLPAAKK